jgi:two-component system sensor histidine kinase EvgS
MNLLLSHSLKILALALLWINFLSALEFTEEEKAWIDKNPVVKLGSDYSWVPYDFVDTEGKHAGISADYLDLVSKKSGLTFNVQVGVWSDILDDMKEGKLDGLSCAVSTEQRKEYLYFTKPYTRMPLAIVIMENRKDITTLEDLNGKYVAVNKGSYLHEWLVKNYPNIRLKLMSSNDASLEAVSFSKVDAYIGNIAVATYIIKTHYLSNLKIVGHVPNMYTEVSIAIGKKNIMLQAIIEKTLQSISIDEGKKILERWYDYSKMEENILALTQEEKAWITMHPTIRIGVDRAWEPFDFINSEGKHDGMSADYLGLIAEKTGLNFVVQEHREWTDVLSAAKNKQLELISAVASSTERASYMDFTDPYMTYAFVLATADKNKFFYEISDFNDKRVGVIKSYVTEDILKENYKKVNVLTYDNLHDLLEALASHDVEAIFDNAVSIDYHIKKEGYAHIKMVTIGEYKRSINMGVVKGNPILLSILNKALKSISPAEKKSLRDKWVSLEYEKTIDYTLVYQILGLFLLFILGTWYWYRKLQHEVRKREQSEIQMSMLIDNIPLNVIVSGFDGSVLRANNFALKTFEIPLKEIYSHNVMEFYADISERNSIIETIKKEGRINDKIVKFKRLDSSEMNVLLSIIPIIYDSKQALLSIMVDLTERIEMEDDLREAKKRADNANKSKSEFLANMSHEIRTPMNAIMGFTELLNEQIETPRLKSYTKTIQNAGKTLLTLINDILDLSKIEAGKLEIQKSAANIFDVVNDVSAMFTLTVGSKGLSLLIDIDKDIPKSLLLDGIRLRQVLVNLVGNAVKFTEEGHIKVSVHAFNVDDHLSKLDLEIMVEDTGIGIPPNQRENIFNSFEQQDGQDNRKFGGTGLGLSISKRLVEMMDGTIMVQSAEKKGATFFIYLYGVDISSVQINEDERIQKDISEIKFKPAKILIVDDIEDNRELIVRNFENTAIEIVSASDGIEAIKQFKKEKPDLILMDIRMPNMDGYEATSKIRAMSSTIPIVALTASVMQDEDEQAKSQDFNGYLRKPILRSDLFAELSQFLAYENLDKMKKIEDKEVFVLDDLAMQNISRIQETLETVIKPLYEKAVSNNSISDIEMFSAETYNLSQVYNITLLEQYTLQLNEAVDTFDIIQIQSLLRDFSPLYEKFKLL